MLNWVKIKILIKFAVEQSFQIGFFHLLGYELTEITSEIYQDVKELYKLPAVNFTFEAVIALQDKVSCTFFAN